MIIQGKILKYDGEKGRNINTDVIWPGSLTYHHVSPEDMRRMVMKNYDEKFAEKIIGKNILAAGENFGCGSSREQPAYALRHAGIEAIISPQFSRIFQRNALAAGLATITSGELYEIVNTGDSLIIDLQKELAYTKNKDYQFKFSKHQEWQVQMGGLIPVLAYEIAEEYLRLKN